MQSASILKHICLVLNRNLCFRGESFEFFLDFSKYWFYSCPCAGLSCIKVQSFFGQLRNVLCRLISIITVGNRIIDQKCTFSKKGSASPKVTISNVCCKLKIGFDLLSFGLQEAAIECFWWIRAPNHSNSSFCTCQGHEAKKYGPFFETPSMLLGICFCTFAFCFVAWTIGRVPP